MQFIKTDIDGTGKKWRLAVLREQGTIFYFPEEDFEDLVENYEDCEKRPVPWLEEKQTKKTSQREDKGKEVKIVQLVIAPNNSTWQGQLLGLGNNGITYIADACKWVPIMQNIE